MSVWSMAMRSIELEQGLKVRFPGQDASFADGVEIGVLAALMTAKHPEFDREIALGNLEQARALGRKLGYHLADQELAAVDRVRVTFRARSLAPKLRLVASAG
ncbi:hypothetical protein [Aureimonas leprariae]|uniref:Uncharacterized protein n=1 Tax=Plantimonas leprariae TaxID=2615207 RepID=A0A7V7PLI6_9HYPH|nr:hypothetical protein [Aureimonas leprariae]KAB0677168.1 hypothetical protein F6X38_18750 [Aureimonas leprariae]